MDIIYIPPSLVLGCNDPISVNALSDFIEEATGRPLDLIQSGFCDSNKNNYGSGCDNYNGSGYGAGQIRLGGHGRGDGDGFYYGNFCGDGRGDGYSYDYIGGDGIGFDFDDDNIFHGNE